MPIQSIPQPYIVQYEIDDLRHGELTDWLRNNIENYFYAVCPARGHTMYRVRPEDNGVAWEYEEAPPAACLFMFECPRDALLFKLAWGGQGG